ncbi:hypothetical protein FRC14_007038 [Serendipita sp. 396]|nr:hypothetical protein FRC14_007038 [Serendipita sp. 396]KAG8825565.1 hypothetical protein FRC18_010253 [Serendipita sp. 400]KAG8861068.1 hypothetical protein FRC20_011532 [Serendipita sp. 405]
MAYYHSNPTDHRGFLNASLFLTQGLGRKMTNPPEILFDSQQHKLLLSNRASVATHSHHFDIHRTKRSFTQSHPLFFSQGIALFFNFLPSTPSKSDRFPFPVSRFPLQDATPCICTTTPSLASCAPTAKQPNSQTTLYDLQKRRIGINCIDQSNGGTLAITITITITITYNSSKDRSAGAQLARIEAEEEEEDNNSSR